MMNNGMMQGMGMGRGAMMGPGQQNGMANGLGGGMPTSMGGMGAGMGRQMGGPQGLNPQGFAQPQHVQQNQQIQRHIIQRLRDQPKRSGWQSVMNLNLRLQNINQLWVFLIVIQDFY